MDIQLYEVCEVSNNSIVTNKVLLALNEKLTDEEKRDFRTWLSIVRQSK